jgi:hypothetical protein
LLNAVKRTSSALKSVGLRMTRTPFDSVHSVAPTAGIARSRVTRPARGADGTSGASLTLSA